jgi:hypothetical protein
VGAPRFVGAPRLVVLRRFVAAPRFVVAPRFGALPHLVVRRRFVAAPRFVVAPRFVPGSCVAAVETPPASLPAAAFIEEIPVPAVLTASRRGLAGHLPPHRNLAARESLSRRLLLLPPTRRLYRRENREPPPGACLYRRHQVCTAGGVSIPPEASWLRLAGSGVRRRVALRPRERAVESRDRKHTVGSRAAASVLSENSASLQGFFEFYPSHHRIFET